MAKKRGTRGAGKGSRRRGRSVRRSNISKKRPIRPSKRPAGLRSGKRKTRGRPAKDVKLQTGLRLLRTEKSIAAAARKSDLSASKLRTYAIKKKLLIRRGKKWVVQKDVPRKLLIFSGGQEHVIQVETFKTASRIGTFMAAVRWFVQTNNLHHLEPFVGKFATDSSGKRFSFETRPNVLHRLASSGSDSFEQIYRIVV